MPDRAARLFPTHVFLFEDQADLPLNKSAEQVKPVFTDRDSRMIFKPKAFQFFQVGADGSGFDMQTGEDSAADDALAQKLLSAQADEDLDSAVTAINEYYEETKNTDAVSATIAELANNTISSQNYNDYTFTDGG